MKKKAPQVLPKLELETREAIVKLERKGIIRPKTKLSHRFITALSIVSIIGFISIAAETLFNFDFSIYTESLLMLIVGVGLVFETRLSKLRSLAIELTSSNVTHLITIIIGFIAVIAGIFSIPQIALVSPGFLAIKGIISIIAIAVIIVQTWIVD